MCFSNELTTILKFCSMFSMQITQQIYVIMAEINFTLLARNQCHYIIAKKSTDPYFIFSFQL